MPQTQPRTAAEIEKWIAQLLGELLEIPQEQIQPTTQFDRYGLDSSAAISITEMLGNQLGRDLQPTLLYDFPTIQSLAKHLAETTK